MAYYEIDEKLKENESLIALSDFKDSYNSTIPDRFPQVSVSLLRKFKNSYPSLFKEGQNSDEQWSVSKHRKKVMDWLTTQDRAENSE